VEKWFVGYRVCKLTFSMWSHTLSHAHTHTRTRTHTRTHTHTHKHTRNIRKKIAIGG